MSAMRKYIWIILFALLPALALATPAAASEEEAPGRAVVLYDDAADPEAMEEALTALEGVTLLWRYDSLFPGAAVEAGPEGLRAIEALDGVAGTARARSYVPAGHNGGVESEAGLALMGADGLREAGWTGDGTVIAVLDSGLNVGHQVFADGSLAKAPAISQADVSAYAAKKGTAGRYVSPRIPFVYDYYDRDNDVSTTNGHGTHVAALAAGYVQDGGRTFSGAAPGAQILGMKIFPDNSGGGTDDAVILRALEDAWNLGADVINLSVGTGAGFSRDDILDGAYSRAYALLAEDGVIVCCSAGNEASPALYKTWAESLPTGAYTDYSAVTSPASYRGAVAVAAAGLGPGGAVMAPYSAWGPASGLHLAPALTAFGGPVVSAGASGEEAYYSDYGTSMASGSTSGLFAVTLQALRERGVTNRKEAARLAQGLLESTAQLLDGGANVPASPRKQGAGLADLEAALASQLVVTDPLAELGDNEEGRFTLSFSLRNLSGQPVTVSVTPQVLTDGYVQRGGVFYSAMSPRDITSGVTVSGPKTVSIPAGGTARAELTLTVSDQLRRELAEVYPNGFYVEGFVTFSGGGQAVHGAFLGYCGDWEAAPVMGGADFRDLQDVSARMAEEGSAPAGADPLKAPEPYLAALGAELGADTAYLTAKGSDNVQYGRLLGSSGCALLPHDDGRCAIPGQGSDAMHSLDRRLTLALYTLRDAAGVAVVIQDAETGKIYHADAETWLRKSMPNEFIGRIDAATRFSWDGTDAAGRALPGGTKALVSVYAWLDDGSAIQEAFDRSVRGQAPENFRFLLDKAYDAFRTMRFPVVIDSETPVLTGASMEDAALALTFRDDQYLAHVSVQDGEGRVLAEEAFVPASAGETCKLTVDLGRTAPDVLYVTAEDYASNAAGYAVDLAALAAGGNDAVRRTAKHLVRDVDASDWYAEAVDYAVSRGLMECGRELDFRPNRGAVREDVVSALYRANGSPASKLTAEDLPFTDLERLTGCADALCWAYEQGLVSGRDDGTFDGSAGVTRQELAVMLYRGVEKEGADGGDLSAFSDAGRVAGWAKDAVSWAVGRGLLRGSGGRLAPEAGVTRAETAEILRRFLEAA